MAELGNTRPNSAELGQTRLNSANSAELGWRYLAVSGDGWYHARHQPKFEHRYSISKLSMNSNGALIPRVYHLNALSVYMAAGFSEMGFEHEVSLAILEIKNGRSSKLCAI